MPRDPGVRRKPAPNRQNGAPAERNWWWRDSSVVEACALRHAGFIDGTGWEELWKRSYERAALRWEILRRTDGFFSHLAPWPTLSGLTLAVAVGMLADPQPSATCRLYPLATGDGWAKMGARAWNLNASDDALVRQFLAFIERERRKQRITAAGSVNRGAKNRPASWLAVELIDRQAEGEVLGDSERGNVSRAKREAGKFAERLRKALEAAHSLPRE